jgi:uncharacterized protein (TIGR00299 family) protein
MKIAYFDAVSGIAGDMTVAAFLDAERRSRPGSSAASELEALSSDLASLELGGYQLAIDEVEVGGIPALSFKVVIDGEPVHDPDWTAIRGMLEAAGGRGLDDAVVERALGIFSRLAEAEAKAHGVAVDEVHFHEVGSVDSIVDIVASAWCLVRLGIESCFVGALPSGSGFADTRHGRLPVPTPATVELLRGFEVIPGDGQAELVTPTGAALLAAEAKPLRPSMHLQACGVGAGTMRLDDRPNVLRVLVGEAAELSDEEVVVIETDIDDMSPEALAHAAEILRGSGAREVNLLPSQMKKGRLGMRLTVIADLGNFEDLAARILSETSSIGLRYRSSSRVVLPRHIDSVDTEYGPVALKVVVRPDGQRTAAPEFDDVSRLAAKNGVAIDRVHSAALEAWTAREQADRPGG